MAEQHDFGRLYIEQDLGPLQRVAGAQSHIGRGVAKYVWCPNIINETDLAQNAQNWGCRAADQQVNITIFCLSGKILQGECPGGVEIAGVFQAQNDGANVGVFGELPKLFFHHIGGTEEEVALDVHEGNGRWCFVLITVHFRQLPALV